jgi:hypothetical protein
VAHHGVEVARCSVPRGGNWIDAQLATEKEHYTWDSTGHQFLDTARSREWKEQWGGSLLEPRTDDEQLLVRLYGELIDHACGQVASVLAKSRRAAAVRGKLAVAVTGGPTRIGGFDEFFARSLSRQELPIDASRIRPASQSAWTVARGLLIQAELEAGTAATTRRAA